MPKKQKRTIPSVRRVRIDASYDTDYQMWKTKVTEDEEDDNDRISFYVRCPLDKASELVAHLDNFVRERWPESRFVVTQCNVEDSSNGGWYLKSVLQTALQF